MDPATFYKFAADILPDREGSSPTHAFLHLLQEEGKLRTNYTQNIDDLERRAGITKRHLIQCHGSFATATCRKCPRKVPGADILSAIREREVPYCSDSGCLGVMKPDITFFGENLSDNFSRRFLDEDVKSVDLVLVIGTSLKVALVNEIPNHLPPTVPLIFISREPTRHVECDVQLIGNCDDIVAELARRSGLVLTHEMVDKKAKMSVDKTEGAEHVWIVRKAGEAGEKVGSAHPTFSHSSLNCSRVSRRLRSQKRQRATRPIKPGVIEKHRVEVLPREVEYNIEERWEQVTTITPAQKYDYATKHRYGIPAPKSTIEWNIFACVLDYAFCRQAIAIPEAQESPAISKVAQFFEQLDSFVDKLDFKRTRKKSMNHVQNVLDGLLCICAVSMSQERANPLATIQQSREQRSGWRFVGHEQSGIGIKTIVSYCEDAYCLMTGEAIAECGPSLKKIWPSFLETATRRRLEHEIADAAESEEGQNEDTTQPHDVTEYGRTLVFHDTEDIKRMLGTIATPTESDFAIIPELPNKISQGPTSTNEREPEPGTDESRQSANESEGEEDPKQ